MNVIHGKNSFLSLNHIHAQLFEIFVQHQICLMNRDLSQAVKIFRNFSDRYAAHMQEEELYLLPLYTRKINPLPPGGGVDLYLQEHRKIELTISEFLREIKTWEKNGTQKPLDLVYLFDKHYRFRDLLNHHHAREDTFLYRLLDRVVDKKEREVIFTRIGK